MSSVWDNTVSCLGATQLMPEENGEVGSPSRAVDNNIFGLIRLKIHGMEEIEYKLSNRLDNTSNGARDCYTIGRHNACDIVISDRRVSSFHCKIYCDYSMPKFRIFIEDSSGQ